jgi:hypothetical protein
MASGIPADILTETINTLSEVVRGNQKNQVGVGFEATNIGRLRSSTKLGANFKIFDVAAA